MKMRKLFAILLSLCIVFSTAAPVFAQESFDYDEAYEWAIDAGYPEEFLEFISEDPSTLREIYYEFKDADELEVTASHEHMSVESNSQARGNISSSDLDFWMVASKFSTNGYITYVRVHVAYEWIGTAAPWQNDAVAINWDAALWEYRQLTSEFTAEIGGGGINGGSYDIINNPATAVQGGIGWYVPLNIIYEDLYGTGSFKLFPRDSQLLNGTRYSSSINAVYAHEVISLTSLSISASGVSVTFSGDRDEMATNANVTYGV